MLVSGKGSFSMALIMLFVLLLGDNLLLIKLQEIKCIR